MENDNGATIQSMNVDAGTDTPDSNYFDDNVVASTSSNAIGNTNEDDNVAAEQETIDVKPMLIFRKSKKKRRKASKTSNSKSNRFKCDRCDYKNAHKSRVNLHAQVHNTEKPFHCEHCNKRFGYAGSLKKHLNKRHNVILL